MSPTPGWYPDPGGAPGRFRYWDGAAWSARTTTDPNTPPPTALGIPDSGQQPRQPMQPQPPRQRPNRIGWWIGGGVAVIAIAVAVVLLVQQLAGPGGPIQRPGPGGQDTAASCPETAATAEPVPDQGGDRVVSGPMSYPRLGAPWSPPQPDRRVPFGAEVSSQTVQTETSDDGSVSWYAGVIIARLLAGDGFYEPEQGASLVAECVEGVFYGNTAIERNDIVNEATEVDGKDAWVIESELSFDIPDIEATSELMIIVVVDTKPGEAGLFYASIPGNAEQYEQPAREALAGLRVG